jgi:hypothetical protein
MSEVFMGAIVFDDQVFDSWLTKKSDEILSKVDREKITTEEMLVLILKAQTNHFHHMDVEFRQEFKKIDERFDSESKKIDLRFDKFAYEIDKRFENIDKRFDKVWNYQKWQIGLIIGLFAGVYLKLFLG